MVDVTKKGFERAVRLFKRECEPILRTLKAKEYHMSRSERRRVKEYRAQRRREKIARESNSRSPFVRRPM